MPRVIHFEIPAEDPDKLAKFYSETFGWLIQKKWSGKDEYWLIHTGFEQPGINGGIKRKSTSKAATINTIEVSSVEEFSGAISKAGGKMVGQKIPLKGTGFLAYCEDPEGNPFAILEKNSSVE